MRSDPRGFKNSGYLFRDVSHRVVQGALARACRSAKIRARTPHDLRHSYASILLMDHFSPAYVQKQLGHHSISMTVDLYGHWIPGEGREGIDAALDFDFSKSRMPRQPKVAVLRKKEKPLSATLTKILAD